MINLDSILKSRDITLPTKVHLVKAMVFLVVMYGCESWRRLSAEELMLLNCGVGEDSWESLGLQGDQMSQSYRKSVLNIHWKDWYWSWNSNPLDTWHEELTHWKRPWSWERLKAGQGTKEDEMVGWHHQLDGQEFEQAPGVGDGQGSLVCCSPRGRKEWTQTWLSNWTDWREISHIEKDRCCMISFIGSNQVYRIQCDTEEAPKKLKSRN